MKSKLLLSLALLLVITSAVFMSCKKGEGEKAIFAGAEFLPQDSAFFLTADWESLSKIDAFKKEIDEMKQEVTQEVGLDVFAGLKSISLSVMDFNTKDFEESGIVVLKGKFEKDKILDAIRSQEEIKGINETEYSKIMIYTPQDEEESDLSMAFADEDTVILSGLELVKKAIDVKNKKVPSINDNQKLADALKGIKKGSQIYGAGIIDQQMKDSIANDPMSASFATIDVFTLSLLFNAGRYEMDIVAKTATEEDAKQIVTSLNGFWEGMAKPMLMGEPQYQDLADVLKIDMKGTDAILNISITDEQIEKIKNFSPGFEETEEIEIEEEFEEEPVEENTEEIPEEGTHLQ